MSINIFGLIVMMVIMIPNIIFAVKEKELVNKYHNKVIEVIEQVVRYSCMFLMVFNISLSEAANWFTYNNKIYMIIIGGLCLLYCFIFILYFKNKTLFIALALAILPTIIFLISGIFLSNVLLIITAVLFGMGHITITYHNSK